MNQLTGLAWLVSRPESYRRGKRASGMELKGRREGRARMKAESESRVEEEMEMKGRWRE